MMDGAAERATQQKYADRSAAKAQKVRKAAAKAKSAKDQLSSGVLDALNIGEMALLNRLQGQLPETNLATLKDATKLGNGVVLARSMAAQDAAAFNLWAQNAMIRSAKVDTMVVDKLGAGTFTAGNIVLAGGGALRGGSITVDGSGITMGNHNSSGPLTLPGDLSITNPQGSTNIWSFFTSDESGIVVRSDPITSNRRATVFIGAFPGKNALIGHPKSAAIELYAGTPDPGGALDSRMDLNAPVFMRDGWKVNLWVPGYTISDNAFSVINHGQGTSELFVLVQVAEGGGQWRDISFKPSLFIDWVSNTQVKIVNQTGSNRVVRIFIYKLAS